MRVVIFCLFISLISTKGISQETHYWAQQVGARATLLSGAVTAATGDNSAIYYNPAGLGFIENSSLSVVGNLYYLGLFNFENGLGNGVDLQGSMLEAVPQIFSGIKKNPYVPDYAITYAYLNAQYSVFRLRNRYEDTRDVFSNIPGEELIISNYEYHNRIRDDYVGIATGRKLTPHFGLGLSTLITMYSLDYSNNLDATTLTNGGTDPNSMILAQASSYQNVRMTQPGILWKLGSTYRKGDWNFGLVVTTPRINVSIIPATVQIENYRNSETPPQRGTAYYSLNQEGAKSRYKSPWIIDFGASYTKGNSIWHFRIAYFSKINPYFMIERDENTTEYSIGGFYDSLSYTGVKMANKSVVNIALGWEHNLTEKTKLLLGFRTDFNYFDDESLSRQEDFVPNFTYWDLYHFSGGLSFHFDRFDLITGLNYARGRSSGDPQLLNLSNSEGPGGIDNVSTNTSTQYDQIYLLIGFNYFFGIHGSTD